MNKAAEAFINSSLRGNAALAAATPDQEEIDKNLEARRKFTEGSIKGGATGSKLAEGEQSYIDTEALGKKKHSRPSIQSAPSPRHSNRKQQVKDELGAQRNQMMQGWLNERRDTSFDKYRGPRQSQVGRPRGVLSK